MRHMYVRFRQGRKLGFSVGWRLGVLLIGLKQAEIISLPTKSNFDDLIFVFSCVFLSQVGGSAAGILYGAAETLFFPAREQNTAAAPREEKKQLPHTAYQPH